MAAGADVHAQNEHDNTPLHCAANAEVVKALVKAGANVNAKDKYGETPLHWAAKHANIDVAKALVAAGADIHAKNQDGNTPIDLAMEIKVKQFLETAEKMQFLKPIIICTFVCLITATLETGVAAFLITNGVLLVQPFPITLAIFAIAAITLTAGMVAHQAFKPNKPSTKIDATQTSRSSNSTISSVH
ncbi:ankyrin repeat domain-containing protein [Wolbachia endosymbiont of Pentalonia nigronervosa]|nr:ankyrin repeat domain-containing protein [Wolbachia endosymbiont of Pentalonia nigronervosa]